MIECELLLEHLNVDSLPSWPVTWGVALCAGTAAEPGDLAVATEQGESWAAQARVLSRHNDGSIHRMIVTAEPAVPADASLRLTLRPRRSGDKPIAPTAPAGIDGRTIRGAAGAISLEDDRLIWRSPQGDYSLSFIAAGKTVDGQAIEATHVHGPDLAFKSTAFEPFEHGPIEAATVVQGELHRDGQAVLHIAVTLRMPRITPVVFCSVTAKNLTDHELALIDHFEMKLQRHAAPWTRSTCEVRHFVEPQASNLPMSIRATKLAIAIQQPDRTVEETSRMLSYNETWLSAENDAGKLIVAPRNFFEYYPYGVSAAADGITVEFWPRWHGKPWRLAQGRGKTHELLLGALPPNSTFTPRSLGYAFGKPPLPRLPLKQLAKAGVMAELPEYQPDYYPRMETLLFDLAYNRNRGYGKMNYGDDYSEAYTQQRRGAGAMVWNNLEGDHPYHMLCQFTRTGRYWFYKDYRDSILHWSDVDFCDKHKDRAIKGALTVHSAAHITGGASPCHNWAESFKEWYFHTGDPRPRKILQMMGDWLVYQDAQGFFKTDPQPYVRGCGWGLIQMLAIDEALGRPDLEAINRRICRELLAYCRKHNGLVMAIPTGGVWTPRDNAFHTVTVLLGAYQCWKRYGDPAMRELALAAAEPLMDTRTATPEGIAVYITGPEQDFPMQQAACFAMGGLAIAYRLTGDERFVRRGARMLEYCLDRGMIVDHLRIPGTFIEDGEDVVIKLALESPNTQLLSYQLRGLLLFMRAAHDAGLLKRLDYQF